MTTVTAPRKNNPLAFEEARESVARLSALRPFLAPADVETLSILMDKKLLGGLQQSLSDSTSGKVSPLRSILSR